ncbi:heterokaryon incompatibility protein-domain-containing protein [Bisporella sp. PMI_857]|nr:heterokaryon incompatibility protein-domain-containing protein [Bisporella sp. PMI_857]
MSLSFLGLRQPFELGVTSQELLGFQYVPLTRPKEIRVLYFDEKADQTTDGLIALRIAHITLAEIKENHRKYTALSYFWGTGAKDKVVKINGLGFKVTSTLESALRNIGNTDASGLFWIDAICINQNNVPEKNTQVAMMGEIYAAASVTLVWLGECNPAISEAIDMLEEARVFHNDFGVPAIDLNHTINDLNYNSVWQGVHVLLAVPWWRRMWVIQEIALGQRAMILCGTKTLMFQRLALGAEFAFKQNDMKHIFPVCENGFSNYWRVYTLMQYRMRKQEGNPILLQELLENNVSCEASDPRDMVFSLFGLATNTGGAPELTVDYGLPVEEVYLNIVKFHIREYESLDMICHGAHPKRHRNLASWVPDFSNLKETTSSSLATFSKSWPGNLYWYNASGTSIPNNDALAHGPGILRASAIFVDKIAHVGEMCWPGRFSELFKCLASWNSIIGASIGFERDYIGGGPVIDAFNRTICGDKARSGLRAPRGWRGLEALEEGIDIPNDFRLGPEVADEVRREAWVGDALQAVALRSHRRSLIITKTGYIGLGPPEVQEGDLVSILLGCSVPVILRPKGESWWFVGESFVCGIMDGEILKNTDIAGKETKSPGHEFASQQYHVEQISLV